MPIVELEEHVGLDDRYAQTSVSGLASTIDLAVRVRDQRHYPKVLVGQQDYFRRTGAAFMNVAESRGTLAQRTLFDPVE